MSHLVKDNFDDIGDASATFGLVFYDLENQSRCNDQPRAVFFQLLHGAADFLV